MGKARRCGADSRIWMERWPLRCRSDLLCQTKLMPGVLRALSDGFLEVLDGLNPARQVIEDVLDAKRGSITAGDLTVRSPVALCPAGPDPASEQIGEVDVVVLREVAIHPPVAGVGPDLPAAWPDGTEVHRVSFGLVPLEVHRVEVFGTNVDGGGLVQKPL